MVNYVVFFNDTATTEIYTLSLHDALPIYRLSDPAAGADAEHRRRNQGRTAREVPHPGDFRHLRLDRKSTRLNSSHANISYAVFCLKKKKCHPHIQNLASHVLTHPGVGGDR